MSGDLIKKISAAQVIAGENAVIDSLKDMGFPLDDDEEVNNTNGLGPAIELAIEDGLKDMGFNRDKTTLSEECVTEIIKDLSDRSGIGNAWESIDEDIQNEMKETWAQIIDRII